ncbi:Uncharacterized protein BN1183_AO_00770 [Pantoea ananatis]|nr:Uncharacterized protein BN1183_AO_00770 [Pantoea ananatis]
MTERQKQQSPQKRALLLNLAGVQGFEPRNAGIRNQCLTAWRHPNGVKSNCLKMAGVQGFEPRNAGIRNQCLTAWRHPKKMVATTGIEPVTPAL